MQRIIGLALFTWIAIFASPSMGAAIEKTLSLEDCIQLALERNLDIRIQRFAPEIARYNLNVSYAAYEPSFSFTVGRDGGQQPGGLDEQNRVYAGTKSDADSFSAGIQGLLPIGMSYRVGVFAADRYGTLPPTPIVITNMNGQVVTNLVRIPFEQSSANLTVFELRQPLLRDAWFDAPRLSIELDRAALETSEITLRQQVMNTATSIEIAYYNLIYAGNSVKVQQKALELAERLLAENRKRVEVGSLAPLDEKQAEAEVASRHADLLTAQRAFEDQQNILKSLLTDDYSQWHDIRIVPATDLTAVPYVPQLKDSWMKGLLSRPEIRLAQVNLERQDITIRYQKNQLYPQLDLVGSYGYSGGGVSREYSDAFAQIGDFENPTYTVRAELIVPLGNRAARNNLRVARATREQLLLSLKRLEQGVMVEIDNVVGQVNTSLEKVEATKQARIFATAALEAEQKKLENGKSTSFEVLSLQRNLVTAANSEIRALADYNIALAQLALAEASTLERLKIGIVAEEAEDR